MRVYDPVPAFAKDYPGIAQTITHVRLSFYCMNCLHKTPTSYITPNFGPLCEDCIRELANVCDGVEP